MSFEDKLKELEKLISEIESGEDGLNKSIEKYAKAQELADELGKMLEGAKESLNIDQDDDQEVDDEEEE